MLKTRSPATSAKIEPLRRLQPAMSRDDPVRLVDQNWGVEAERFDAAGDRADLLRGVLSRIVGIRNDGLDGQIGYDRAQPGVRRPSHAVGWLTPCRFVHRNLCGAENQVWRASEAPMPVLGRTDYGGKSSSSGRDFVSAGGGPICGTAGMMITGNFKRRHEQHLVHSIDHRIRSERRLEIWRPRMERVVTPNSSSFDKIEAARRRHSQIEQEVSGLGGSPNSRTGGLSPCELPCGRYGARASYLFIDLPGRQDLVSSRLWFATLGNKLRKLTCLATAPADLS